MISHLHVIYRRYFSACCAASHSLRPLSMDIFRQQIASQVSTLSGAEESLVLSSIEEPKTAAHGDLAIAIPRLRLKGNPAALALSMAAKVFLLSF